MIKYIIASIIMLGIQAVANADGVNIPNAAMVASAEHSADGKSFFDVRTKEDIQRMIDFEAQFSSEMSAEVSPSNGGAG